VGTLIVILSGGKSFSFVVGQRSGRRYLWITAPGDRETAAYYAVLEEMCKNGKDKLDELITESEVDVFEDNEI
jgi:hypothetical protein